jgi:arylformamidase
VRRVDLSMPLRPGMPAFPNDPAFRVTPTTRLDRGDPYDLSELTLGSHTGTHVDPPRHFRRDGLAVDRLDLDALNGRCVVLDVGPTCTAIEVESLRPIPADCRRVLFRSSNSARWARGEGFFPDYVSVTPTAAEELVRRKMVMVGIDALSIESDPSERYPVHHALLGAGIPLLEGLLLADAPEGTHTLECLPLRLVDGDGGPARAVLRVE